MALSERLLAAQRSREGSTTPEQKAPDGPAPDGRRVRRITAPDPFAELKRVVHAQLVGTLGPKLYDVNMTQSELEQQVRAALQTAVAGDRPADVRRGPDPDRPGDRRRHPRLRPARALPARPRPHRGHGQRRGRDLRRAGRQARPGRRRVHRRGAPAPDHRQDRRQDRPTRRRDQPDGRRSAARRQPGQRDHPAAGPRRLHADHPQVRRGPVHRRGPHRRSAR